jgi:hypothetical protein
MSPPTNTRMEAGWATGAREMTMRLRILLGVSTLVALSACGRAGATQLGAATSAGTGAAVSRCAVQTTTGLLTASEIATQMAVQNPPPSTSNSLGLFGNGDSAYPGYVGNASASFYWTGLASPNAQALIGQDWARRNYSGTPPPGDFLPSGGELYTAYPHRVFLVAEGVDNFGSVVNAEQWMRYQRQDNPQNTNPKFGNGVESDPTVAAMGDDIFVYQLDRGAPTASSEYTGVFVGDVYTDLEVRAGALIYSISVDASPGVDSVGQAVSLAQHLMSKEAASCSSYVSTTAGPPSAAPPVATSSVSATPSPSPTLVPGVPATVTPVPLP